MTDTTEKVFVYHYRFREWTGEALVEGSGKVTRERLNEWLKASTSSTVPHCHYKTVLTAA